MMYEYKVQLLGRCVGFSLLARPHHQEHDRTSQLPDLIGFGLHGL